MEKGKASASALQNHSPSQENHDFTEDRISALPEHLLILILSLLSFNEAVRTAVLSSKWKDLWTYATSCFDITVPEKIRMLKSSSSPGFHEKLANEIYLHVMWVNKLMGLHRAPYIDDFSIAALLDEEVLKHVDSWIQFALGKGIQNFKLDFSYLNDEFSKSYTFPSVERFIQLQDSIHATPARCCLKRCTNEYHRIGIFCSLKSFSLSNIDVSNDVLEYLMSNCQFLEQLHIVKSKDLVSLKVIGSRLKSFQIIKCFNLKILEILAKNLENFEYDGPKIDVSFQDVPSCLLKLTAGEEYGHSFVRESHKHLKYVRQLERLKLTMSKEDNSALARYIVLPQMINLKHLELLVPHPGKTVLGCLSFIVAAPFLSTLKFKYQLQEPYARTQTYERDRFRYSLHYRLKEVELVGFVGTGPEYRLISRLKVLAMSLRKLVLQFEDEKFLTPATTERVRFLWWGRPQQQLVMKLKDAVV